MAVVERKTLGERTSDILNIALLLLLSLLFVYPLWQCVVASFSDPVQLIGYRGLIFKPMGFSLAGYKAVLRNKNILTGYGNTLFYLVVGTVLNMLFTIVGAYALTAKKMLLKKPLLMIMVVTMYVDFGLIPAFLNIRSLGLYNNRWALILPGLVATYNLIVMRTAFLAVPPSLPESAMIDGANDFTILWRIIIPVSKATIAVIALFYAVGHWNSWFSAAVYLRDRSKYPLQLFMREILIANSTLSAVGEGNSVDGIMFLDELIKYCTIIISTVPILLVYPFVQKYFVTGVMLGSIKE
ncbi:sugar ABC transporter permease [Clostridia bacterium]|nr:sugar ABC transporter permease [Clostridia bacterium]